LRWEAALDLDALREALGRGPDWIGEQKRILETIETAVRHAEAILAERRMRCMQHEEHRPTEEEADAIAIRLRALEGEKAQASHVSAALQLDVKRDEERKSRHAQAAQALADQEARTRLWAQMNELIGSADGKKFRNYAQQFTLDILLAHANRHLANLSRRYRVERLGATLGLMVIDQDMGDEARSVHSLSGGESFLVSLALALALASLSSDRISVESLFIDEGFGSLDSDTLLVAMEALDQLQAQGRKVGVISHVQEMTERIGTQIQIRRTAGGYSRIIVPGRRKPADQ
jgi:exonuclease SbcC